MVCQDCKRPVDASTEVALPGGDVIRYADMADDDKMLQLAFPTGAVSPTPAAMAESILSHPLLVLEDARLWTGINEIVGTLDPETDTDVYQRIIVAIAAASCRTPYVNPNDLGFEVEAA